MITNHAYQRAVTVSEPLEVVTVEMHQGAKRGRRKSVGAVDTSSGNMAFVAGYCSHGDKILLSPTELEELINSTYLRSKDIPQRMFIYLHTHFSSN